MNAGATGLTALVGCKLARGKRDLVDRGAWRLWRVGKGGAAVILQWAEMEAGRAVGKNGVLIPDRSEAARVAGAFDVVATGDNTPRSGAGLVTIPVDQAIGNGQGRALIVPVRNRSAKSSGRTRHRAARHSQD